MTDRQSELGKTMGIEPVRDKHGREVKIGDVLKMYSHTDRSTNMKVYQYLLVREYNFPNWDGPKVFCTPVPWLAFDGHDYGMGILLWTLRLRPERIEIVDGYIGYDTKGKLETWYERPKVKKEKGDNDDRRTK